MRIGACLVGVILSIPAATWAQTEEDVAPSVATVEVMGGWGVQIGDTEYLPDGAATDYKFPFFSGFGGGATAGYLFLPDLAVIATYEYWWSQSVEGDIPDVIDSVRGSVSYHTVILGLRLYRDLGPGRLRADMGIGIALPFSTEVEYDWGDGLAAAGITGTGTKTDDYGMGFGLAAQMGYEVDVGGPVFVGAGLQLRSFQSDNNGEETTLDNVADLAGMPPTAINATIDHGNGEAQPTTFSVQDIGIRIAVGARF